MNLSPNATSSAAAPAPPPPASAAASIDLSLPIAPPMDVPFTSISGIRRIDEDGGVHWEICIGARHSTGIAHGHDFRSTLADAIKDLAQRKLSAVR